MQLLKLANKNLLITNQRQLPRLVRHWEQNQGENAEQFVSLVRKCNKTDATANISMTEPSVAGLFIEVLR